MVFGKAGDYPTAWTAARADPQEADALAAAWVLQQHEKLGGQILLLYPTRRQQNYEHGTRTALASQRHVVTATWLTLTRTDWQGGPVLAAWPNVKTLNEIADHPRTTALCVLTYEEGEIRPWAAASQAMLLGGDPAEVISHAVSDPIVIQALETIAMVNHKTLRGNGYERTLAVSALRVLTSHGHELDSEGIYTRALANEWPSERAQELRDLVDQINSGLQLRIGSSPLQPDIYERWQEKAAEIINGPMPDAKR